MPVAAKVANSAEPRGPHGGEYKDQLVSVERASGDQPGGAALLHLAVLGNTTEESAQRGPRLLDVLGRRVLEHPRAGAGGEQELDGGLDSAVAHGQIVLDSFEPDVAKAGAAQDLLHSIGIAQRVGAGSVGRRRRGHRQHGGERLQGTGHPRIARQWLPAQDREPPGRPQGAVEVLEGGDRVGEEHDAEAREHDVEGAALDRRHLSVAFAEVDRHGSRGSLTAARRGEHRPRDVESDDAAARGDAARDVDRGLTGATADVEHALARLESRSIDRLRAEGADQAIEDVLALDPHRSGDLVPVTDLLFVAGGRRVGWRRVGHDRSSSVQREQVVDWELVLGAAEVALHLDVLVVAEDAGVARHQRAQVTAEALAIAVAGEDHLALLERLALDLADGVIEQSPRSAVLEQAAHRGQVGNARLETAHQVEDRRRAGPRR